MAHSKNSDIDVLAITAEGLWFSVLQSFAYPAGQTQMNERCQSMNDKPIKAMEGCPRIKCQGDKLHSGDRQSMLSRGRLQNGEEFKICQYAMLLMLLTEPCDDQHKRICLVLREKQKNQSRILWSASFPGSFIIICLKHTQDGANPWTYTENSKWLLCIWHLK